MGLMRVNALTDVASLHGSSDLYDFRNVAITH